MNSLLQQLFMIPGFRHSLLLCPLKDPTTQELVLQMKLLFGVMQERFRPSFNAAFLCNFIRDFDDSPLSIYEQKDVDEFFNLLLERIDNCISDPGITGKLLGETFGGAFANEIVCGECGRRTDRREGFLSVNLQVKGKKQLEESLDSFIEAEALEGKNSYHCEVCKKSCKAKKRVLFKELPNTLVIVLKRFNYDVITRYF